MLLSIPSSELHAYTLRLANHLSPTGTPLKISDYIVDFALQRLENCFSRIRLKYFSQNGRAVFNHLHGDHFAMYLWFLANSSWQLGGEDETPTRLSIVNKALHGIDLFYNVQMPEIFLLVHPVGTVLGRASYSDYLVVYQNCTIGSDGFSYPTFGGSAILYSGSSVIGDCHVGDNVVFGANASIVRQSVPANSRVTGQTPNAKVSPSSRCVRCREFTPRLTQPEPLDATA